MKQKAHDCDWVCERVQRQLYRKRQRHGQRQIRQTTMLNAQFGKQKENERQRDKDLERERMRWVERERERKVGKRDQILWVRVSFFDS